MMVSELPSGSLLWSAFTSRNEEPVRVLPLQAKVNSRAGLRAGFPGGMNSVWVIKSVSRCVTIQDAESNATVRSIWSLPMVQLWQTALEAESNNTTAANNFIARSPPVPFSSWESEELDEHPHALFLTAARKSLGSCELGDPGKARPTQ